MADWFNSGQSELEHINHDDANLHLAYVEQHCHFIQSQGTELIQESQ